MFDRTQRLRQRHLSVACAMMTAKDQSSTRLVPDWSEMYVDDDRRYIYCLVSKVSCTSWKRVLLWMTGKVPSHFTSMYNLPIGYIHNHKYNDQVVNRMVNFDEPEMERRLRGGDYYKFMFVREPVDRLVSAYRDKVLIDPTYHAVGDYIVKHHRSTRPAANESLSSNVADSSKSPVSSQSIDRNQSLLSATVSPDNKPTFAEFIDYVLTQRSIGKKLDRHWRPQAELCSPCLVDYDFIGHQETLHADAEHVIDVLRHRKTTNLTTQELPSKYNDIRFPDSDTSRGYDEVEFQQRKQERKLKSSRYIGDLLAQLSDETLRRIVDLYETDYELFGFDRPVRHQ